MQDLRVVLYRTLSYFLVLLRSYFPRDYLSGLGMGWDGKVLTRVLYIHFSRGQVKRLNSENTMTLGNVCVVEKLLYVVFVLC